MSYIARGNGKQKGFRPQMKRQVVLTSERPPPVQTLDRGEIEAQLDYQRQLTRCIAECATDAMLVIDMTGHITFVNRETERLFGFNAAEMMGRLMHDTIHHHHPDGRPYPASDCPMLKVCQRGETVRDHEDVYFHKSGAPIHVSCSNLSLESGGQPVGAVFIIHDLTERKQAEAALEKEYNLLRTLIDNLPDCVYVKDTDGRFVTANPATAAIMGAPSHEALRGRTDADFYPAPLAGEFRADEERVLRTGEPLLNKDEPHAVADGSWRTMSTTKVALKDHDGHVVGLLGITRDITERKQAEEEVRRLNAVLEERVRERTAQLQISNDELESFAYSVAHDLRAPLRHIVGFTTLLRERAADSLDEHARDYTRTIHDSALGMGRLIDDLLLLAHAGRVELQKKIVPLDQIVEQARAVLLHETEGRDIHWDIEPLPAVHGDPGLLRQVFINLIGNALKFTRSRPQTEIQIGCYTDAGRHVIYIRDNGVGFDMHYVGKLFRAFQRLHNAPEFEGNGIGLALVQRIIFRHGGQVCAESKPDTGTVFYFTLPNGEQHPA